MGHTIYDNGKGLDGLCIHWSTNQLLSGVFFSIKNKNLFIIAVSPLKSLYSLQNVQSVCIHFLKEEFYILYTLMLYDQLGSTFG